MSTDPLAFVGLAVALLAGLSWIIRAQIAMGKQFTPNGGSSLRDAVNRLERDAQEMRADVRIFAIAPTNLRSGSSTPSARFMPGSMSTCGII